MPNESSISATLTRFGAARHEDRRPGLADPKAPALETRLLNTRDELTAFAKLRYDTWLAEGYVNPDTLPNKCKLELDYLDFFSTHVGLFLEGTLIAGGRIIFEEIRGDAPQTAFITEICSAAQDPVLSNRLRPRMVALPFDLIDSFPDYDRVFKRLFDERIVLAELSRLIVRKDYRGKGLSTPIMQFMIDHAKEIGIGDLVLTCGIYMIEYYKKFDFRLINDINPGYFGDIQVESVVMDLRLS